MRPDDPPLEVKRKAMRYETLAPPDVLALALAEIHEAACEARSCECTDETGPECLECRVFAIINRRVRP